MLLVLSVDETDGSADVIYAEGPPNAFTRSQAPSNWRTVKADLRGGVIQWIANSNVIYRFALISSNTIEGTNIGLPNSAWSNQRIQIRLRRVE